MAAIGGEERRLVYVYVGNIPKQLRSADLRAFFSQFIEGCGFHTFHFKHRREQLLRRQTLDTQLETLNSSLTTHSRSTDTSNVSENGRFPITAMMGKGEAMTQDVEQRIDSFAKPVTTMRRDRNPTQTRPNIIKSAEASSTSDTSCCVTKIYENRIEEFRKLYTRAIWYDQAGKYYNTRIRIKIFDKPSTSSDRCKGIPDFDKLEELNPPPVMPNGNVGTPLAVFMNLINACILPGQIIKKLGLEFPKSLSKRRYGNVPLEYLDKKDKEEKVVDDYVSSRIGDSRELCMLGDETATSTTNHHQNNINECIHKDNRKDNLLSAAFKTGLPASKATVNENVELCNRCRRERKNALICHNDEEADAEDWERHETLHDDVDAQARTKERLFEEDIELKWEKGGSGLVFYTDAYYWHEMKGKDFDEETVDDWDVDMSVYSETGAGDKDARDMLKIRVENRRRKGLPDGPTDVSEFEQYTKGFGSKQLRKNGWIKGCGLGASGDGIPEPVEAIGQSARDKTGLGYLGEKLNRHPPKKRRAERDVIISTAYDQEKDGEGNALQRTGPDTLKYVCTPVDFVKGTSSN